MPFPFFLHHQSSNSNLAFFLFLFSFFSFFFFLYFSFIFVLGSDDFEIRLVRSDEGHLTYQCGYCGYLPDLGLLKKLVARHIIFKGCFQLSQIQRDKTLTVHKIEYRPLQGGPIITLSLNDD